MYPKICTSRNDHNAKVVVANAEQEAELPEEFQSLNVAGQVGEASDTLLSPAYDDVLAAREQLEKERAEFAAHMLEQEKELAARRDELTAGYKASMDALEADRAEWDAAKLSQQPDHAPEDEAPEGAEPKAKRGRPAKAE